MKPSNPARLRTVEQAALVTGRPHWTIRTWAREGHLPHVRQGGRLLVDLVAAAHLSETAGRRRRRAAA